MVFIGFIITMIGMGIVTYAGTNAEFKGSWIVYGICIAAIGILFMCLQALT